VNNQPKVLEFGNKHAGAQYRKSVGAVIYHKQTGKVLALDWHIYPVYGIVQGGQDEGEEEIEALRREIVEETGYSDFSIEQKLGENIISYFYADNKKVWRQLELACYFVELRSTVQVKQNLEKDESFELKWVGIEEFIEMTRNHQPTQSQNFQGLLEFLERAKQVLG